MREPTERLEAAKALNEVVRRSQSLRSNLGLLNRVMTRAKTRGEALKLARFSRPSRRVVPGKRVRRWTQQGQVAARDICPCCDARLQEIRADVFECSSCGNYSRQVKRWPVMPVCPACFGLSMIPGSGPDADVMNTPCPECNPRLSDGSVSSVLRAAQEI
jgi:hypothetical protein